MVDTPTKKIVNGKETNDEICEYIGAKFKICQ